MTTTPATNPDPEPLWYGRRAPLHRRGWVRWCLVVAMAAGVSVATWRHYGQPWLRERARLRAAAQERARMLALQQEWMTYREPADRAMFVEPPDLARRLQGVRS